MILSVIKPLTRLLLVMLFFVLGFFQPTAAAELKKIDLEQADFLLLDVTILKKRLLQSIEAYQSGDQTLLPVSLIISALGAGIEVDLELAQLLYTSDGVTTVIELASNDSSIEFTQRETPYLWGQDDFEIYLSNLALAQLIEGIVDIQLSRLNVHLVSINRLFPIEKQWQRADQRTRETAQVDKKTLYVPDVYQLLTPPTADIALSLGRQSGGDGFSGGFSAQTSSDILYHSARISLFKNIQNSELTSRVNFTRHQASPDEPLLGGLNQYSFGDISTGSNSLFSKSSSGVGLKFSRRPENISGRFGSQTIEGDATPGWDVELHYNGFLLSSAKVPDNGHYVFEDIATEYGNNHFEIRLFGPFGEEEIRPLNIKIGGNWLPKGEVAYSGFLVDKNKSLFNNKTGSTDTGKDYGFSFDYSPFDNTNIGTFFQQIGRKTSTTGNYQNYFGSHIQTALSNLVLDLKYTKQQDEGQHVLMQGIGVFPWGQNYNVLLEDKRNFSNAGEVSNAHDYSASFATGGILPFTRGVGYRAGITYTGNPERANSWLLNTRLSWRLSKLHFSNILNYYTTSESYVLDSVAGNMTVSSKVAGVRVRASAAYTVEPNATITNINVNASWQSGTSSFHNVNSRYNPSSKLRKDESWQLSYTYSTVFDNFRLFSTADYDSEKQWSVNLGLKFFFDYDGYNDRFIVSSLSSSHTGNLNITSYLDRNDNNRRDEADWSLNNVAYSPLPIWRDRLSNRLGQTSLSGVPVYTPFTFSANANTDVATKQPNYTIYTHPGSRVNIEIPFTIQTSISGFVMINALNGERALTTGKIILLNLNTLVSRELQVDIDGFYEENNLNPGHYQLQVAAKDLQRLGLVPNQGTLQLITPKLGGYYELASIVLSREKDLTMTPIKSTKIVLDESNGEAFYFDGAPDGQQMYASPWDPRLGLASRGSQNTFNNAADYVKYATPNDRLLTVPSNENIEVKVAPSLETNDNAMRAEATKGNSTISDANENNQLIATIAPSKIASDAALRAEAAGSLIILPSNNNNIVVISKKTNDVLKNYVLQTGAFGLRSNAHNWLNTHSEISDLCRLILRANLHIIQCGAFESRNNVTDFQLIFKRLYPGQASMIKKLN